jgi:hypothetical protein
MIGKKTRKAAMQLTLGVSFLILCFSFGHAADVTLTVESAAGLPGTVDNLVEISLDNDERTTGLQFDICRGDFLSLSACDNTTRTPAISCNPQDLGNGCDRIIFFDFGGEFIDAGTGPLIELRYDASPSAVEGTCQDLTLENVTMPSCIDDGSGGCTAGPPLADVVLQSGQFCFDDTLPTTTTSTTSPTTTTTTSPTTTPTTTPTTIPSTTSTVSPLYEVSISPSLATLDSGATLQFSAKTTDNGEEVEGTYSWEIVPVSAIGSSIDGDGLFAAGENAAAASIEETVKVTDTAHQNKSATATVIIKVKEPPLPGCEVRINPAPATVASGDMLTFTAQTIGDDCETSDFDWSVDSDIGSAIDGEGNYTAGSNKTESPVTDTVTVVDRANGDFSADATIDVEAEDVQKTVAILPDMLLGSRWIPLPYLLLISGEDVVFDLSSTISFEPGKDIFGLGGLGFGDIYLALILLGANPDEGTVAVSISTEGEVVSGEITIGLFPAPFSE